MTDHVETALECVAPQTELDVGKLVEWMVDPDQREKFLRVTYEFSQTGDRKTVWYTHNKRRAKRFVVVTDLQVS